MVAKCDSCSVDPKENGLAEVVDTMCAANYGLRRTRGQRICRHVLPSRDTLVEIVEQLRSVLFPGYFGKTDITDESVRFHVGATLDAVLVSLQEQIKRGMCFVCEQAEPNCPVCERDARRITRSFLDRLPEVRRLLAYDVQAAYEGDPAATCPDEAILCYPGIMAITNYRLAHELFLLKVPLVPRIITEHAHGITGIDIHPGARIGERFFIDHGTGVVIGETSIIGRSVRIYQGVTLGAKSFPLDRDGKPIKGVPRHPIVEDEVVIYGGATILGRVTIGRGSIVGGNVWLVRDVPPGCRVTQAEVYQEAFEHGAGI